MHEQIVNGMAELDEESVLALVQEQLAAGADPMALLAACQAGMNLVGQRYECGEYYLSELIMAGEIFKQVAAQLPIGAAAQPGQWRGQVVFGTVKGDIHTIGKDLVVSFLAASGYQVTDLGIDVPPARFVKAVQESGARIVGLSGLLTTAFDSMKDTVQALESAGLRPGVRVMIGGGSVNETVLRYTGADALGQNPRDAVNFANAWSGDKE